jgi:hypothetical protein
LKELGLTPNGYNPKVVLAESTEETVVSVMNVKVEKMAAQLSPKDVRSALQKLKDGKSLTPREELLKPYIDQCDSALNPYLKDPVSNKKEISEWLINSSREVRAEKRNLMNSISRVQFITLVGKVWFSDLDGRDSKEMLLEVDGQQRKFIVEDALKTVKV